MIVNSLKLTSTLFLVRSEARQREVAVRRALGAGTPYVCSSASGPRTCHASKRSGWTGSPSGGQIALALVLLVASGLMVRSFQSLRAADPGFDPRSALTFSIGLPARAYPDLRAAVAAHHAILDRVSALPGVTAVSASTCLPLDGLCSSNPLRLQGRLLPEGTIAPMVSLRAAAGGYFAAMGIRLLRSRGIERGDVERNEPIVVVNQALVDVYFPNEEPIGQRVTRQGLQEPVWLTLVGVALNTPVGTLGEAYPVPQVYMPIFSAHDLGPNIDVM